MILGGIFQRSCTPTDDNDIISDVHNAFHSNQDIMESTLKFFRSRTDAKGKSSPTIMAPRGAVVVNKEDSSVNSAV